MNTEEKKWKGGSIRHIKRKMEKESKRLKEKFAITLLCMVIAIGTASFTSVNAQRPLPDEFRGDVTIDGTDASVGTVIVAKINGIERGNITTTEIGKYGRPGTFDERLVVQGQENEVGHTITFWINGNEASETATFSGLGESKVLDISSITTTGSGNDGSSGSETGTGTGTGTDTETSNGDYGSSGGDSNAIRRSSSHTPEITPTPTPTSTSTTTPTPKITPAPTSEAEAETEAIQPLSTPIQTQTTTTPATSPAQTPSKKGLFEISGFGFETLFVALAFALLVIIIRGKGKGGTKNEEE